MFVLYFVLLAHLVISPILSGAPRYINGRWVADPENSDYLEPEEEEEDDDDSPPLEDNQSHLNLSETTSAPLQTTPDSNRLLGGDPNEPHDSKVWKIVLVTAILLMFLLGSLGTAYYLCIWRGGRIHYQPQKTYA